MAVALLSDAERLFIIHGIQGNLRVDGRNCDDFRYMQLETNVLSSTNGSARLRLGNTDILVGVKADIAEPDETSPNEGQLEFFIDFSANADPEFEGRGGESLASQISSVLSSAYSHPSCIDRKALCLLPHQQSWLLHVDILVLQCGGNLFDAIGIAVKAALQHTKLPAITVTTGEQGTPQLDISDDPYDLVELNVDSAPVIITVSKVDQAHIVDASIEEESCALARIFMAVQSSGAVTYLRKDGGGSFDPDSIDEMLETGKKVGKRLHEKLNKALKNAGSDMPPVGFLS